MISIFRKKQKKTQARQNPMPEMPQTEEEFREYMEYVHTVKAMHDSPYGLPPEADRWADAIIQTIRDLHMDILDNDGWDFVIGMVKEHHFPEVIEQRMLQKIRGSFSMEELLQFRHDKQERMRAAGCYMPPL